MSSRDVRLARMIRAKLGEKAKLDIQINEMAEGYVQKTNGEMLVDKLVEKALEGKDWAIKLIAEYVEGKPAVTQRSEDSDRAAEQRLRELTVEHLNHIAEQLGGGESGDSASAGARTDAQPADSLDDAADADPAGGVTVASRKARQAAATSPLLALPKDRAGHSQDRPR